MTSDNDRRLMLSFLHVWSTKLNTTPGGVATMRHRMLEAAAGMKGQNYDPDARSDRYETVDFPEGPTRVRVPSNDPTGENGITDDEARAALDRLDRLLKAAHKAMCDLAGMHDIWMPRKGAHPPELGQDGPGPDWCSSCWRDDKHCEPATTRYRGRCRFCGDWRAIHQEDPPLPIIKARHRGERITSALVDRYTKSGRKVS